MKKLKSLSIVIPCFNEEDTLLESYKELKPILTFLNKSHVSEHQIVMVNNGSVDRTLEKMLSLKQMDSNIKIVDLRNNFGYQSSISAGLFNADNDLIISIDADLQDDPSKIKEMIELIAALIKNDYAYEKEGHVMFNVPAFKKYGSLSKTTRSCNCWDAIFGITRICF